MKVSDLTGAQLDYWVAKAEGLDPELFTSGCAVSREWYLPSTNWAQGGPIIERFLTQGWEITPVGVDYETYRVANHTSECMPYVDQYPTKWQSFESSSLLLSVMRAYVASKFGEEVPDA